MTAAATVAVAIRWAPSQGRRLFSSSSRSDVQQCGWPMATFVHPVAVFSGPQQWKAGHKIHKMFNGEQQNDGNDNGRVVRKPPRRSRNANGDESDIVRKRARQNSTSNTSGTNRGTTSSQSGGGGGDDWPAFGGGGNNNNSRRTGTTPLDLDMLLTSHMANSDSSRGSTSASTVLQQMPQGSNSTSAADMPMPFLDNNNNRGSTSAGTVLQQMSQGSTSTSAAAADMPMPFLDNNIPVAFSSGGGSLTVAAHMPWGMRDGQASAVTKTTTPMTTTAAVTWADNSCSFVGGGFGAVVAGGMFGRANCGGSVGGAGGYVGMQALPPHIRDAIERVHQRQMQKMITVQPDFADILPQCADNGMSSLGWLMLDWQADMVMGRVIGIVVLCGPFTTVSGLSGFDVRLMFDHDNPQQEMAVHCWEESMPRLANNIQCGAVVEFCRLKVREQGKNNKGSFPYTLLYNNESRHRILSASSNNSANQASSSSNTPIIVEAVEQQQHRAGGSTAASARPSASGTTAIVSTGHHHRNMPITLAQQNTGGGGGNQDVRVAKNGNGNATDVHEQQSEDDGPNATAANLSSVGAQRVVDAEHDDDDEEGTSETAWLSTARPPPPSCTPVGRPLHRRPRRRRLLQSISPQAGPSGGHRSSPPPQRACSISAQRNLHTVVQRINDLEAQVARDERNARERRQRARRQQLLLQQHQHMPLSSSSSPSPPPRPVANAAEADVITIDDVEPLGLEPQQQLHRGDARYFAHELMTLEDEAGAAEMIILDNEPLSVADREWLISTAFKMRQLPSSVKGSVEADENGNNNISCCICHDWLVSDADSVRCSVWPQFGRGRTPRTAPTTTTTGNGTGSGSSNAETAENHEDEDDDTAQLGRYCKVVGVWERTECRSRNTRCEAVEVALNGWAGARRPDTLLAQCITHLMDRVLAGRGRPLRIGMSCQPPKFASPYHIPHRAPEQNTAAAMAAELERLAAQSAGGVDLFGGTVLFRISAVWPLERNSGAGACAVDEREARGSVRCRSFFPVVNPDDTWCLARAVVLGLADRHFQHLYGADSQQATAHLRTFWLAQHGHGGEQAALQFPRALCLIVVSIDHRPEQQTPAGLLSVTNVVLRNADGHRIEASGWQTQAGVLASLSIGTAYWFMNCMARSRYQRLDCWYRIGVDGRNATIIPHPTHQANRSIDDSFVIERTTPMRNTMRNTRGEVCEIRFLPLEDNERPDLVMESLIQHLLDRVLEGHSSPMLVGLQLQPPGFDRPYVIRLRPPEQNNAAALAAAIERLNEQSAAGIDLLSGTTVTKVLAVWPLESVRADAQRGGVCDLDNEHHLSHKVQSLVRVVNPNDRYCLARAVLLGLCDRETRMPNGGGREALNAYARRQNQHGTQAIHLLTRAGVPVDKHMYTLEDVEQLQQYINNENGVGQIRLVVFEKEQEYRIVFKGEGTAARFNLCILLERGHFNYIGQIAQLFKVPGYCIDCERRADARYHAIGCKAACRLCFRFGAGYPCQRERLSDGRISSRKCTECGFIFPNDNCYEYHLTTDAPAPIDGRGHRQRRSLCQWRRFCPTCGRVAYFGIHQCPPIRRAIGPIDCFRCKGPHMLDEPCFIQPIGVAAPLPMLTPVRNNNNNNNNHDENDIDFIINNMGGEGDEDEHENGDDINDDDDGGGDDDDEKDELLPLRLCFFYAETSQDRPLQLNNQVAHKHVPLLIVAEFICEPCIRAGININDGQGQRAPGCVCLCGRVRGQQMRQWMSPPFVNAPGDNTPQPEGAPVFNNRRLFFHSFDNGGKYDFHLVLEALHRRSYPPKRLCTSGLKIYSMKLRGMNQRRITFKDSINYFFCELDALVKSFDLPQHLATVKPFFPYLYIQRQHLHQRLDGLPAIEFYSPNTMKTDKREKFLQWHCNNNDDARFQLREQLIMYCVNDVAILRESVLRFRKLIGEHTQGLDPFLVSSTAAGLALSTLRRCFLPFNRLVHSPEGGYLRGRRASAESRRYIRFFELENPGAQVQCADWSVGEANIEDTGYRVDGFWRREPPLRPLAIEWMGCYYHGCPDCFPNRRQKLAAERTAEDLYERTMRRLFELEHTHGCELHVVWGCQWKERLRRDLELKQRFEAVFVPCPLDPRNDALRGGRTEPFKLHHVCADDEEILCIDIKVNPFPVGNPRVLTREVLLQPPTTPLPWTCSSNNMFRGLLLVRVLAPRLIRVPLLGYRTKDGRFTFPLCAWCADRRQQRPCQHGDDKRSWVCAYTHVELNKALQLGYNVVDLFEVWNYDEWDDDLFSKYVNTFVGLKVQATGWPEGCETDEERKEFVDNFMHTEGIQLDSTKMTPNPGLRLIAKTLANSLWGKMAQRVGFTQIKYTRTPAEFHQLLEDPTFDKLDFVHVSEHMDRVVVRKRPEFAKAPVTNCLPVAIYVTSYARLHLYSYMEKVIALEGAELLYCDTDSIYYVNKMGGQCVPEGEALGQMKREHIDRRIVEFVAGGPKNYGIRHTARDGTDERANLKIRSFRLSYATEQLLNFEAMKDLTLATYNIDGPIDDVIDNDDLYVYGGSGAHRSIRVTFPQIDRNVHSDVYTCEAHKDYRPFYAKGRVRPGMQTRPFGYVEDVSHPPIKPTTGRRKRTLIDPDPSQPGYSGWF
ncbi:hypothetical protein niasHS_004724 [Heterodera schachtii]|uniref:DNA-directed DNA polymerase n=1 Tax=Heterodera schachtii TaxID=97005 RepID=A0ABD2JTD7_HETSC